MKKGKISKYKIVGWICSLLMVLVLFVSIFVPRMFDYASEENTINFEATIKSIKIDEANEVISIVSKEYQTEIVVFTKNILDLGSIDGLIVGETIYFRIEKEWKSQFTNDELEIISIVTLETSEIEIVTFDSFNAKMKKDKEKVKTTGIVLACIFALGAGICFLKSCIKPSSKNQA